MSKSASCVTLAIICQVDICENCRRKHVDHTTIAKALPPSRDKYNIVQSTNARLLLARGPYALVSPGPEVILPLHAHRTHHAIARVVLGLLCLCTGIVSMSRVMCEQWFIAAHDILWVEVGGTVPPALNHIPTKSEPNSRFSG